MGDHRISIKIEFSMHGHQAKHDYWLNWSDKIPQQIAAWVEEQKEKAMDNWWEAQYEYEQYQNASRENAERDELERLKQKYEGQ